MADKEHKCGEVAGTNPPVATPARSEQSKPWSQIYIIRFYQSHLLCPKPSNILGQWWSQPKLMDPEQAGTGI